MDAWEKYRATERFGYKLIPWLIVALVIAFLIINWFNSRKLDESQSLNQKALSTLVTF